MIVVDTSALLAILFQEKDAGFAARAVGEASARHPAALNFGDCFAYGLSKVRGWPLLAVGADFAGTDADLVT